MFSEILVVSLCSLFYLFLMRRVALVINLVDKPNARKLHSGAIPLVGGVSICFAVVQFILFNPELFPHSSLFIVCISTLIILGVFDDKYDISFKVRLLVQAILSALMIYIPHIQLSNVGDIFGFGSIDLGVLSPLITVLAVIGAINAFNMMDGIDGLLGSQAIITLSGVGLLAMQNNTLGLAYLSVAFIAALLPYVLMNLGVFGIKRKVFMGDAGSMMIGFTVIWLLLETSQVTAEHSLRPITALWLVALPLMDMVTVMCKRILRGDSPFKPDREHLHHILQRLGLSSRQALMVISLLATSFVGFGVFGELTGISEPAMFAAFLVCFAVYKAVTDYISKASTETTYSHQLDMQ